MLNSFNCFIYTTDWQWNWLITETNDKIYHMTRTAPHAISLENHKRKGPVWGPYASKWQDRKNAYGPTRNAYGPTRNAYGKIDVS